MEFRRLRISVKTHELPRVAGIAYQKRLDWPTVYISFGSALSVESIRASNFESKSSKASTSNAYYGEELTECAHVLLGCNAEFHNPYPWEGSMMRTSCEILTDRITISRSELSPPPHNKDILLRTDKGWYRWPFGKAVVLVNRDDGSEARMSSSEWKNMPKSFQLHTHIRHLSDHPVLDINLIRYEEIANLEATSSKTSTTAQAPDTESTDNYVAGRQTVAIANAQVIGGVDIFDLELSSSEEHEESDESHATLWAEGVDLRVDMLENGEDLMFTGEEPHHKMLFMQITRQAENARAIMKKWEA